MCGGGGLGGILDTVKKLDPLQGGDLILDKLGFPSLMGEKNGLLASNDLVLESGSPTSEQATNVAGDVQAARDDEKRRRAAAAGMSSTILGGSMAGTQTATKTLLGQ